LIEKLTNTIHGAMPNSGKGIHRLQAVEDVKSGSPVLNPEARAFHERATADGLDIGWYERQGAIHMWMFLPGRHAGEALAHICRVLGG
jgi:hypothetical protein